MATSVAGATPDARRAATVETVAAVMPFAVGGPAGGAAVIGAANAVRR